MAFSQSILPSSINVDLASSLVPANIATYIKNLVYSLDDTSVAAEGRGASVGVFKPLQSTEEYLENLVLPLGVNFPIGSLSVNETKEVYCFIYNSLSNHTIYRIKGATQTYDIVYQGAELNFQLNPEYFIHKGGAYLEILYVSDPITGEKLRRSFLQFTDGFNPQRFICVEDSVATQSFNSGLFPYFAGNYNRAYLISMGVPTPSDCIDIEESTAGSLGQNNKLLFNTWQFRFLDTDVWGRPSEHGMISEMYAAGDGGCIGQSSTAARCLKLIAPAPAPHINSRQIEYRNCNSTQWYRTETINLYDGSQFGEWWLRPRNLKVDYNGQTHEITYEFCADKECDPIDPNETLRLNNPIPRTSQSVAKVGKFTALSGNKEGFLPFSETLKNKLTVTVIPPDPALNQSNSANLDIYAAIYNPYLIKNQPIYYDPGQFDRHVFGAFNYTDIQYKATFAFQQMFENGAQQGFVGYLAGTDVFVISKLYFLDKNTGTLSEVTDLSQENLKKYYDLLPFPPPLKIYSHTPNGTFLLKFEFRNVPKGKYIFRVASHHSNPITDPDYQKTSTYVAGSASFDSGNFLLPINPTTIVPGGLLNNRKEVIVDACDGNYDGYTEKSILIIYDLVVDEGGVMEGYVYDTDEVSVTKQGIELLQVQGGKTNNKGDSTTDHNGYYFVFDDLSGGFKYQIYGYCSCSLKSFFGQRSKSSTEGLQKADPLFLSNSTVCQDYENQLCNYIKIKGKVALCDSEVGLPGISVVLSRGQAVKTNDNGEFTLIAHDDVLNSSRVDSLYFITGSCTIKTCDGECLAPIQVTINKCTSGCQEREISVITTYGKYNTTRGLLSGGTYPIGITAYDWIDRASYIQPLGTVTIPTITESKVIAPSTLVLNIPPDTIFPATTQYITVSIGEETTIEDYVTWVVDSFQFIDNTGKENTIAPTQIKIYYASLIEYNKQNDFNTTVNWGFISQVTNVPVTADKVQFWLNGDGTFFDKNITALVKYNVDGQYFLINYTEDLKDLKANAIIRLERPKVCTGIEPYYEICLKIPIVDRHATVESIVLNAFDTYYINRQIPVPTLVPDTDPPEFINEPRIYGTPFEHNSPSDFWGKGCKNQGRQNVKNPYEAVLYKPDEIALSGALSSNGQLNYLNYFEDAKKINFSDAKGNGIVSVFAETGLVLVVCQNNWFTAGFDDNLLRTNSDGSVQAGSINNSFGKPNVKIGNNYGCNLFDKNTIDYYQGLVHWLDTNRLCLVQNNYDICLPISKNGADGYIRSKINAVKKYNRQKDNRRFFFGGANPLAGEYLLSDKIIGDGYNFNDERDYNVDVPETNRFGMGAKDFRGQYSFCPEMFAFLQADRNDIQLFSFIGAKPQYHYSTITNKGVGMIYGKQANRIIRIVVSLDSLRKKKGLAIAVVCTESLYFVDQILTENQKSRILKSQWRRADFGWYAPILCNQDSGGGSKTKLMDGEMMQGNYLDIRFVGDPNTDRIDSKLQGFLVNVFGQTNNFTTG